MDISKCFGKDCPRKNTCYRYTSKPDELYQSYGSFEQTMDGSGNCDYYWRTEVKKK